ncbi:hypothetical protein RFI_34729 [Reticulomyxa filosa]|uniref:Uncharacterized protein n=1 Tax=Reticulomyxa filosa TaxID=46433 RepID=X6LM26_RETFI|nr:hypothetical protein RFI_34729 [Reticulomyxa filosa]|eukprot:ETO02684.1 hypothetical protein RFI_34729 [Reticulomyxa filosa]
MWIGEKGVEKKKENEVIKKKRRSRKKKKGKKEKKKKEIIKRKKRKKKEKETSLKGKKNEKENNNRKRKIMFEIFIFLFYIDDIPCGTIQNDKQQPNAKERQLYLNVCATFIISSVVVMCFNQNNVDMDHFIVWNEREKEEEEQERKKKEKLSEGKRKRKINSIVDYFQKYEHIKRRNETM